MKKSSLQQILSLTVLVASLGYFVDMFDLLLFPILRQPSLAALGITGEAQIEVYRNLLNAQMIGMLLGGIFWGMLGDKRGRLSTLFGSIALYGLANLANAFVHSADMYMVWRFVAGFGLAGELGAAVTLVSEILPRDLRGYGTTIVAAVGIFGTVVATLVGRYLPWRAGYLVGGGLALLLLLLRIGIRESPMFKNLGSASTVSKGNFFSLFTSWDRLGRFLRCILIGLPTWYVVGILINLSPEFAPKLGVTGKVVAGTAVAFTYSGITLGSFASGFLSQTWGSRKKVVGLFVGATLLGVLAYLLLRGLTPAMFYGLALYLGLATGYWAVFVTIAAEQFGTNLRSTVATTVPNFVRGAVPLITGSFVMLKGSMGFVGSAAIVGAVCFTLALVSLVGLRETHGRDMDFLE